MLPCTIQKLFIFIVTYYVISPTLLIIMNIFSKFSTKINTLCLAMILLLSLTLSHTVMARQYVAILDFEAIGDEDFVKTQPGYGIAKMMVHPLLKTRQFRLFNRIILRSKFDKQYFANVQSPDEIERANKIAEVYGVTAIITGSVEQVNNSLVISGQLMDAKSGEILQTADVVCRNKEIDNLSQYLYAIAQALSTQQTESNWIEPVSNMAFVKVPKGCYQMGSNQGSQDQKPAHKVCINSFWMGQYEVSVKQYQQFVQETKRYPDWLDPDSFFNISTGVMDAYKKLGIRLTGSDYPIVGISFNDATAFAQWLTDKTGQVFRLPTEAEWEYACRNGGKTIKYPWGNQAPVCEQQVKNGAKFDDKDKCPDSGAEPVGSYAGNLLAIYDMSGNVWEWVQDHYESSAYLSHAIDNPIHITKQSQHVVRGGSWHFYQDRLSCYARYYYDVKRKTNNLGFRLVREIAD